MDTSREQRMRTIRDLLDGYGSLSVTSLLKPLAPELQYQTLPESLGFPVRNIDSFRHHAEGIYGIFDEFKMIPRLITDDTVSGIVTIHAQMLGILRASKRQWRNECIMLIRLTEDGLKVCEIKEFVDSAKAIEMARTQAPAGLFDEERPAL
ncbi:hypothetical protein F5Y18DRAFT_360619 [Xylariaceae sp. FL1019]|nr:hypothetical protein F5Y18DRAFT_360619 [Xylariaceae sp. FL1019]